jgi:hypothetical protein
MTLAFIPRIGGTAVGDPPPAWLMPLIGDAIIGLTALLIAFLIWKKKTGLWVWTAIIVWNSVAIWDALSAFVIHTTNPWPEFFMIKLFGPSMFFATVAIHLVIFILAYRPDGRREFLG